MARTDNQVKHAIELKTQHHAVLACMGGCVLLLGRCGCMRQRACVVWKLQSQKIETAKHCLVEYVARGGVCGAECWCWCQFHGLLVLRHDMTPARWYTNSQRTIETHVLHA